MKTNRRFTIFTVVLTTSLLCNTLSAQNYYEKRGDELFAQAQYENALKQYKAAIEIDGNESALKLKLGNCEKSITLLGKAKEAEDSSMYSEASQLYSSLYEIHPLPEYKSKSTELAKIPIKIAQQKQQVEREGQARVEYQRKLKEKNKKYDVSEMDNTIPFNIVKWRVNYSFPLVDAWFSEKSGLVTDNRHFTGGMSEEYGWYALHRFNKVQYTCNYIRTSNSLGKDGYGATVGLWKAVRDIPRNTLYVEDGYYILDLRKWENYKPLYLPYSKEFIKTKWAKGMMKFEYR